MTKGDFILSIVGSIVATILCKISHKSLVYLRSKPFRKRRKRFIRSATAAVTRELAFVRPQFIRPRLFVFSMAFASVSIIMPFMVWHLLQLNKPVSLREMPPPQRIHRTDYPLATHSSIAPAVNTPPQRLAHSERELEAISLVLDPSVSR